MADNSTILKAMLQDLINDRPEQAQAQMHDYFVAKTKEVQASPPQKPTDSDD